jgi:hypothetical protein
MKRILLALALIGCNGSEAPPSVHLPRAFTMYDFSPGLVAATADSTMALSGMTVDMGTDRSFRMITVYNVLYMGAAAGRTPHSVTDTLTWQFSLTPDQLRIIHTGDALNPSDEVLPWNDSDAQLSFQFKRNFRPWSNAAPVQAQILVRETS